MLNYFRFIAHNRTLLAFGFLTFFVGNFGQSFFIGWFGPAIQESLNLSASMYSLAYSTGTLASAMTIIVVGAWIDRTNLAIYALAVVTGLGVAMLTLSSAGGFLTLLIGLYLLRLCGQGLLTHTSMSTMARYFHEGRGKATSLAHMGNPVGEIIMPLFAVSMLSWLGWRGSWFTFAALVPLVLLPVFGLLLWRISQSYSLNPRQVAAEYAAATAHEDKPTRPIWRRRDVLRDARFWRVLPLLLMAPFIITGVFIHQGFLVAEKGWTAEWFALSFVGYGTVHWLGSLSYGVLIDRIGAKHLVNWFMLPPMLGLLLLGFTDAPWVAFAFMLLAGLGMGAGGPLMGSLWAEVYGVANIGAIRSLVQSCMVISTALSPILIGVAIDLGVGLESMVLTALAILVASNLAALRVYG